MLILVCVGLKKGGGVVKRLGLVIGGGDRRVEKEEIWARFKSGEREVFGEGRLRRVGVYWGGGG